jgi:hypothetical protein
MSKTSDLIKSQIEKMVEKIQSDKARLAELRKAFKDAINNERQKSKEIKMNEFRKKYDSPWIDLIQSGMTERHITCLKNLDMKNKILAQILGVSTGRARSIRECAKRRVTQPCRFRVLKKMKKIHPFFYLEAQRMKEWKAKQVEFAKMPATSIADLIAQSLED